MSLPVGIHDNLIFSKAERNEQGTLVIAFKQAKEAEDDIMSALNSGSASIGSTAREQDFLIFAPRLNNFNNEKDTFENVMKKIGDVMAPLNLILQQYMKVDDVKKGWDIWKGTGLTVDNLRDKLLSETMLAKVYTNIVDQFLAMAKPLVNNPEKMRVIFIRKSQASHFPALRKRYLDSNPFIERMSVPASKLRFTKFEIDNKLDDPTPVAAPAGNLGGGGELEDALLGGHR